MMDGISGKRFNMNVKCSVKLTEYGLKIFNEDDSANKFDLHHDVLTTQLWTIMNIFGNHLFIGNPNVPFEFNEIVIIGDGL